MAVAGGPDRETEFVRLVRDEARKVFGGPWQYKEIIGFIRLHFIDSQVRGEYFAPDVKRIVKTRRKVFWLRYYKLAREIEIPARATGEEIFDLIKKYIDACGRRRFCG